MQDKSMEEPYARSPMQPGSQQPAPASLLTATEREQILFEWNQTQTAYPADRCIHELFEAQMARTPDAVAVVFDREQLTYQQLHCRANQLAHYLRGLGVGADALVGICIERSIDMVVGLLGILKAGGSYVPLDPDYPAERLDYMLQDAGVSVLLTQQKLVERLPDPQARLVCLDTDWQAIETQRQETLIRGVEAHHLAYVIYIHQARPGNPKASYWLTRGCAI